MRLFSHYVLRKPLCSFIIIFVVIIRIALCDKKSCSEEVCKVCGVCVQDKCETKYFEELFDSDPPHCPLKDHCVQNKCKAGNCVSTFGSYYCKCPSGFQGQTCDIRMQLDTEASVAEDVQLMFQPITYVLKNYDILVVIKKLGPMFELEFDSGYGEIIRYDTTIFEKKNPDQYCLQNNVATYDMCKTLPSDQRNLLVVQLSYPHSVGSCDGNQFHFTITITDRYSKQLQFTQVYPLYLKQQCPAPDCFPTIRIENCQQETMLYFQRNEKKTIHGIVTVAQTCLRPVKQIQWVLWKHNINFNGRRDKPEIVTEEQKTFHIKPFSLEFGQYKLKLQVQVQLPQGYLQNFANCFFEIVPMPLYITIEGGDLRNVNSERDLVLDASGSLDPNEKLDNQRHLILTWWCDQAEFFCRHHVTKEKQYRIKGPFIPGTTYIFSLQVTTDTNKLKSEITTQTIKFTKSTGISLKIECRKNCAYQGYLSNPAEILFFEAIVTPPKPIMSLTWTYSENSGQEKPVDNIRQLHTDPDVLIIKQNALSPGNGYNFYVTGEDVGQKAGIFIKMSNLPQKGKCTVVPTSGTAIETLFNITCVDFKDDNSSTSLEYEYYDAKPGGGKKDTLLGINKSGVLIGVYLTGGVIAVYVTNTFGVFVKNSVTVQVLSKSFSPDEVNETLVVARKRRASGDFTGSLSLLSLIADVIENEQNKSALIEDMLGILSKMKMYGLSDIKMVSNVLEQVITKGATNEAEGLSPTSAARGAVTMKELMKKFLRVISISYGPTSQLSSRQAESILKSVLVSSDILLSCKNSMLIDKSEHAYRTDVITKFQKATEYMIASLQMATRAGAYYLLPSLDPFIIETDKVSVWAKVETISRVMNMSTFPSDQNFSIYISPALAKSLGTQQTDILLEVISFKRNPYWWSQEEATVDTPVLSFKMSLQENEKYFKPISNLEEPLGISFNLEAGKKDILSGSVELPETTEHPDKKDMCVAVYRVDTVPYASNGRIYIQFLNMSSSDGFRVQILQNIRPDYDSVMTSHKLINKESPVMHIDYDHIKPKTFNYIGILPGPQAVTGVPTNYTFEIYSVHCMTRSGAVWSGETIKIAGNTTQQKLHCSCYHLSIFGSLFQIPPNELNIFEDISMFLTILDNPAVPILIACLLLLFFILLAWSARKDKKDRIKRVITILEDNFPGDTWPYLVTVETGFRCSAGTTANVGIRLIGSDARSRPHILQSSQFQILEKSSDDWFLIFTEKHLGEVKEIHLWQDYTGSSPQWYCNEIVVHDLTSSKLYTFIVDRWFSLEHDNYSVYGAVKTAEPNEVNKRPRLILENTIFGFRESHTWTSIIMRHPRSTIRTTHRLAIAMCNVMTTMLTSIMFFGATGDQASFDIPFFTFTTNEIIIGLQSTLISMPMTFILLFCFRKSYATNVKSEETKESQPQKKQGKLFSLYETVLHKYVDLSKLVPVITADEVKFLQRDVRKIWFFLAWFVCCFIIFVCSFLITLYGLKFGKVKSHLWAASVVAAVVLDILLLTPLKIIFSSFLLSVTFEKFYEIDSYQCNLEHASKKQFIGDKFYLDKLLTRRSQPKYRPLSKHQRKLLRLKEQWKHHIWWTAEFLIIGFMFVIICLIASKIWTANHYTGNHHLLTTVTANHTDTENFHLSIKSSGFMEYVMSTLIPALYAPTVDTADDSESDTADIDSDLLVEQWTSDYTTQLVNVPQLRQLRVKEGQCSVPKIFETSNLLCSPGLYGSTEDRRNYTKFWRTLTSVTTVKSPWTYMDKQYADTVTLLGRSQSSYHRGGYIAKLSRTHKASSLTTSDLKESKWLDNATRAVIIEMISYNANTNLLTGIALVTEFLPAGLILTDSKILSVEKYFVGWLLGIPLLLFFSWLMIHNIILACKFGFLAQISIMLVECALVICGISFIIMYLVYLFHMATLTEHFQKTNNFFGLFSLFDYAIGFCVLFSIIICLFTIKCLKCCRFGIRMSTLYSAFKLACKFLICIFTILLSVLILQPIIYWLINGISHESYSDSSVRKLSFYQSYNYSHHYSSSLLLLIFIFLYGTLYVLSIVILIYFMRLAKSTVLGPSFNYLTFIFNEIKTCFSGTDGTDKGGTHTVRPQMSGYIRHKANYFIPSISDLLLLEMVKTDTPVTETQI